MTQQYEFNVQCIEFTVTNYSWMENCQFSCGCLKEFILSLFDLKFLSVVV